MHIGMKHTLVYSYYVRSITLRVNVPNFKGISNIAVDSCLNDNYHKYDGKPIKCSILTHRLKF
jgi:hypothetical protein